MSEPAENCWRLSNNSGLQVCFGIDQPWESECYEQQLGVINVTAALMQHCCHQVDYIAQGKAHARDGRCSEMLCARFVDPAILYAKVSAAWWDLGHPELCNLLWLQQQHPTASQVQLCPAYLVCCVTLHHLIQGTSCHYNLTVVLQGQPAPAQARRART